MTAYEVIQQHPEWVKNPTATRKAIEAAARRYVRELNNNALIVEDLDALLIARNALLNPTEEAKDFAQIAIVGNEIIDDGAERMAKVYAIFIKAIIATLNGKAICTAAQIQEWRERYGVKLEGLQAQPEKVKGTVRELKPIADLKAEKVFIKLKNWGYIDCNEDVFLWHFGERKNRVGKPAPDKVKWNGDTISIFSLVGDGICEFAGHKRAEWNLLRQHFSIDWTNAQLTQGKQDALDNQEREEIAPIAEALEAIRKADEEEKIKRKEEAAEQRAGKNILEYYLK
ncbi:MAG: hypothetical protein K5928_00210 [Prevotella sp.]|nr:hypothetical protein [Prevotella sp.]